MALAELEAAEQSLVPTPVCVSAARCKLFFITGKILGNRGH